MISLKKWVKNLIIIVAVILAIVLAASLFLYFTSAKYKLTHDTAERVYIYHNDLGREIYEFTDEEKAKLIETIENIDIGKMKTKYEPVSGAPYFPFMLEYSDDRTVEIYFSGEYLHINSVPFEIDEASAEKLAAIHREIEDKILPLSPEIIKEIIDKKLPQ